MEVGNKPNKYYRYIYIVTLYFLQVFLLKQQNNSYPG